MKSSNHRVNATPNQRFLERSTAAIKRFSAIDCLPLLKSKNLKDYKFKYLLNSALIILFALLHTADGIVTYLGLKFDYVDEVNPVLIFFAGILGLGLAIFLLKLVCLSVIAVLFSARRNLGNCWSTFSLISADLFYSWVVSNNIFLVATA